MSNGAHDHDHDHDHDHGHEAGIEVNPQEQETLAHELAGDLDGLFIRFIHGEIDFAELSFATYDVLQDLYIVSTGAYEVIADNGDDEEYSDETAAREQEDLAGEPSRP